MCARASAEHVSVSPDINTPSLFIDKKLKHREFKYLAQGHTAVSLQYT